MVQFIANIALSPFLGMPLIAWGGMFTFILLLITAYIGVKTSKGEAKLKTHKILVAISLFLAFFHGLVGFLSFI